MLEGKTITPELAASAADVMLHDAQPLGDNAYKLPIAKALVRRTLFQLLS